MRKRVFGRKLKRDKNQRKALFRSLMNSLILEGRIKTTEAKAKSIKADIEKLVTKAKKGDASKSILMSRLVNEKTVEKMITEIGPKFASRSGGYTRIVRFGPRVKDGAEIVEISFVEEITKTVTKEPKRKTLTKTAKRVSSKTKLVGKKIEDKKFSKKASSSAKSVQKSKDK